MVTSNDEKRPKKRPYVRPELDFATVFEASGTTCCKVTVATCASSTKSAVGKASRTSTKS